MIDQPNKKYYSLLFSLPAETEFSTLPDSRLSLRRSNQLVDFYQQNISVSRTLDTASPCYSVSESWE